MIKKIYPQEYYQKLESIGTHLREYRLVYGYTQKELAEELNIHRNTLSAAENGRNITLLNLIEITETLSIDLDELFCTIED
jgi:transcriptional regulator with XRE-family HTH domain